MRAANESRMSAFEKLYKAERTAEFANSRCDEENVRFATLSAADLKPYAPPDPYRLDRSKK
jgi:hypothetical protein